MVQRPKTKQRECSTPTKLT